MAWRKWFAVAAALILVSSLVGMAVLFRDAWFTEYPFPLRESDRFFDMGIVDANGDGLLDIYTSNHHFRQALLIRDSKGGYRDVLSEWGMDQSPAFPMAELSFSAPSVDRPGVYVYWLGTDLIVVALGTAEVGPWTGSLQVLDPVKVMSDGGFRVDQQEVKVGSGTGTRLTFASEGDGKLVLRPGGQGLPIDFRFDGGLKPDQIFVGLGKVSPRANRFSLAMLDRHALAWADLNGDGTLDLFINRGALAGTLRALPEEVSKKIKDELLVSHAPGRFSDETIASGIEKKDCSGRHAKWVDFNSDGKIDLFVNCHDRGNVGGDFPKQLYRQDAGERLQDVAQEVGLGLPDRQMNSLAWLDVDDDGDQDLVAFEDDGVFLYRNQEGRFAEEIVYQGFRGDVPKISHTTEDEWAFDGKVSVGDYNADGDLDVFVSSKRGNILLRNRYGTLEAVDPASLGLPRESITGNWVDFDNDGLVDLHLVPQGLYRQRKDYGFELTGQLAFDSEQYRAAVCNWFDIDNDGRLDVLMVLSPNPEYKPWWQYRVRERRRGRWDVLTYRNIGPAKHWLQVDLQGPGGNPQGISAKVTVLAPTSLQTGEVGSSEGAFYSQGHYRLYFGLGTSDTVNSVKVRWSDGREQDFSSIAANRRVVFRRD